MENITIRLLNLSDIYPEMLDSFIDKQIITEKWVKNGDNYELTKTDEEYEWNNPKKIWVTQYLRSQMNEGGFVAGAFLGDKIVGFASLDGVLQGTSEKYVNLTMFFVDNEWRQQGIGKMLFKKICHCSKSMKADKIFISAIPAYDTVAFYFNMGCTDAKFIIEEFVDTKDDRYLEYDLKKISG